MPPRKRAPKKPREEKIKSPRSGTSSSVSSWEQPNWWSPGSSSRSQERNLDQYAEFVNMPVGILVGFLVPNALYTDWRMMTKDQRLMLLVLFVSTMISAFLTFIFSASFIQATSSRSVASSTSSPFSTAIGAQRHSRFLYLFMYLSFMLVLFLTCVQSPTLRRKVLYPKLIFTLAVAGKLFALLPPTARHYNNWISSNPPKLHMLRHVAIAIVLFGFSSPFRKGSMQGIKVAVIDSYYKFEKGFKNLKPYGMRKIMGK